MKGITMSDKLQKDTDSSSNEFISALNPNKKPQNKYHLGIEQDLEDEIGLEVQHGQLLENELNSGNDI